jgi:23S rRNA pseudouridine2605 synthase
MINKPRGYITTSSDLYDRKKVTDLVKDIDERLFAVGRLDRDASGLLLMTNDGEWGNKIMHPRYNIEKEYLVELDEPISKDIVQEMNKGVRLKDGFIKPKVKMISKDYCSIVLHEGKNKIVKRIFNEFGVRVIQLKRIRVGEYYLSNLKPGKWREIKP